MTRTLIHLQVGYDLAKCGKHLNPERLTNDQTAVSCRACERGGRTAKPENQSKAQIAARQSPYYGDPNYPGAGKLRCRNCNQPYRDHPLAQPCPYGPDR